MRMGMRALVAGAIATIAAGSASAAITGSKHDFRAVGGGTPIAGVTDICGSCHVPHRPLMNVPLWAHAFSTQDYYLYNSNASYIGPNTAAYDAASGSRNAFTGSMAKTCLGCHDGTVAVAGATFITTASSNWIMWDTDTNAAGPVGGATGNVNLGLKGSHPVGVNYSTVQTNQPTEYKATPTGSVVLENGRVQCVSCHNAHAKTATKMLVEANTNSALCMECHTK